MNSNIAAPGAPFDHEELVPIMVPKSQLTAVYRFIAAGCPLPGRDAARQHTIEEARAAAGVQPGQPLPRPRKSPKKSSGRKPGPKPSS